MPLPRLPGLGIEKILLAEEFVRKAISNFFCFRVEGGYERLCFLRCANWSLCLDGDNRGIGCGGLCDSSSFVGAISGDMPFLVTMEAKSALNPLSFFFIHKHGPCPCLPNVYGIWVVVI